MPRISDIILDDTGTLTAADWDYDPNSGDGSHILAEIDAPEGYSESTVLVSPWL